MRETVGRETSDENSGTPYYEAPRVEAVAHHFLPDNSGGTCSICGNGTYDEDSASCEECGEYSGTRVPGAESSSTEQVKRRRLASTIGQGNDDICVNCVFPMRREDGRGRTLCYYCVLRGTDPPGIVFCRMCGFFVPRSVTDGLACKWCREMGYERSQAAAVAPAVGEGTEREGLLELAKKARASRRRLEVNDRYSKIVAALDTPNWRTWLVSFLARQKDDVEDDDEAENALEKLFEHYDVNYYDGARVYVDFVRFIMRNELERFGKDPKLRKAIEAYRRRVPAIGEGETDGQADADEDGA